MQYIIRPMCPDDFPLLQDFLYEAIYVPEGKEAPDKAVIEQPELQIYIQDFGCSEHDRALIAEVDGQAAGAVWVRIMNDYGHVDDDTPSFAISMYPEYRGMGIGTALMREMLEILQKAGYRQASLSVQKANYATRMYQKLGFEVLEDHEEEYIMVRKF